MTADEILNRLLFLVPNAKCAVWDCALPEYMGEVPPVPMERFLVCWNASNSVPCPTYEQVVAVRKNDVDANKEALRKASRDAEKGQDLAIIAGYESERKGNPNLDFSAYLDFLESRKRGGSN